MSDDLKTLVAQEVAKQLAAIAADQTTKKVLEFLKNRNSADAYVVETGGDSTNWFRVWSDGFIEQGGFVNSTGQHVDVALNTAFQTTTYYVGIIPTTDGDKPNNNPGITSRTTTSFHYNSMIPKAFSAYWYAAGF